MFRLNDVEKEICKRTQEEFDKRGQKIVIDGVDYTTMGFMRIFAATKYDLMED